MNLAAQILREIEQVEFIAKAGSPEHTQYLQQALYAKWPVIKAILMRDAGTREALNR